MHTSRLGTLPGELGILPGELGKYFSVLVLHAWPDVVVVVAIVLVVVVALAIVLPVFVVVVVVVTVVVVSGLVKEIASADGLVFVHAVPTWLQ